MGRGYKTPDIINTLRLAPWKGPSLFGGLEKCVVDTTKARLDSSRTLHAFSSPQLSSVSSRPVPHFNLASRSPRRQDNHRGSQRGVRGGRSGRGGPRASASVSHAPSSPRTPSWSGFGGYGDEIYIISAQRFLLFLYEETLCLFYVL